MATLEKHTTVLARVSAGRHGLRIGIISSVINTIIFGLGVVAGIFPYFIKLDVTQPGLTVFAVVLVTFAASFAAVWVWNGMVRLSAHPWRTYIGLAGVVLVLSFAAPYAIPGTTHLQALLQNVMHVVVGMVAVWVLRGAALNISNSSRVISA